MTDPTPTIPPRLLFITPIVPRPGGQGVAMRAFETLRALSMSHRTSLLITPLSHGDQRRVPAVTAALCAEVAQLPLGWSRAPGPLFLRALGRLPLSAPTPLGARLFKLMPLRLPAEWAAITPGRLRAAGRRFPGARFEDIHVFRLFALPFAEPFLTRSGPRRPRLTLDLDDLESLTRARIADLMASQGDTLAALLMRRSAALFRRLEERWLPRCDRVLVCSEGDRQRLRLRALSVEIEIAPNIAPLPPSPPPPPSEGGPLRLLFIGAMGYYPNADAVRFLLSAVAPRLDARLGSRRWRLDIVGRGVDRQLGRALDAHPSVDHIGPAADIGPLYRRAHIALAPIRAGGGTRIKILEAFAHRRPVVATTLGAEGLAAEPGTHYLRADTAEEIAAACAALASDDELRDRIVEAAADLVSERYTFEELAQQLTNKAP